MSQPTRLIPNTTAFDAYANVRRTTAKNRTPPAAGELTDAEKRQVEELKRRDMEVRRHEMAHKAAGAGVTGALTYSFQTGPDGHRYAVGGEVVIDASPESDPEATIQKMKTVKRAALAPAQPSGVDRAVARRADQHIIEARQEILAEAAQNGSPPEPGSLVDTRA